MSQTDQENAPETAKLVNKSQMNYMVTRMANGFIVNLGGNTTPVMAMSANAVGDAIKKHLIDTYPEAAPTPRAAAKPKTTPTGKS